MNTLNTQFQLVVLDERSGQAVEFLGREFVEPCRGEFFRRENLPERTLRGRRGGRRSGAAEENDE